MIVNIAPYSILIRATPSALKKEADRIDYQLRFNPTELKKLCKRGFPDKNIKPIRLGPLRPHIPKDEVGGEGGGEHGEGRRGKRQPTVVEFLTGEHKGKRGELRNDGAHCLEPLHEGVLQKLQNAVRNTDVSAVFAERQHSAVLKDNGAGQAEGGGGGGGEAVKQARFVIPSEEEAEGMVRRLAEIKEWICPSTRDDTDSELISSINSIKHTLQVLLIEYALHSGTKYTLARTHAAGLHQASFAPRPTEGGAPLPARVQTISTVPAG
jgi:hypothetical protein